MLNNKTILVTGGTGSFGQRFTEIALKCYKPKKLIIYSRDEFKQHIMRKKFPQSNVRFFIGDIRDRDRLTTAFSNVDYVIHAAALKQIPALEYNPTEAIRTNVNGAENIISAALENEVKKVIALSSDKAVNPINLYGATKLCMEKLLLAANAFGGERVKFSIVRYGNVVGSRGSVVEHFLKLKEQGVTEFPITDVHMTRFWITLTQAVNLVISALETKGNEIYIPKLPSMMLIDLANAMSPGCTIKNIGIRKGEKMHEMLDYNYCSETNDRWLRDYELKGMIYENGSDYTSKVDFYTVPQ